MGIRPKFPKIYRHLAPVWALGNLLPLDMPLSSTVEPELPAPTQLWVDLWQYTHLKLYSWPLLFEEREVRWLLPQPFIPGKNEGTEAKNMQQSDSLSSKIKLKNLRSQRWIWLCPIIKVFIILRHRKIRNGRVHVGVVCKEGMVRTKAECLCPYFHVWPLCCRPLTQTQKIQLSSSQAWSIIRITWCTDSGAPPQKLNH